MFVRWIFPRQIHLFKMHIFIHLPSVDLNTGVKSEITFLPELEHNSVHVKNRKQYVVNYRVKIASFESKWQNFQCYGYMTSILHRITISCTDSPVILNLTDFFCLVGFCFYWREDSVNEVANSSSSQLLQFIGDSDWQVRRSQTISFGGSCLHFSKERRAEVHRACCLYAYWYCIPAKPWELQFITRSTLYSSKTLPSMPEDCLCLSASTLFCFHLLQEKGQTTILYLSRLNHLKPFVPNQTKIALYRLHSVIC